MEVRKDPLSLNIWRHLSILRDTLWGVDSPAGCLSSGENCVYYELKESIFMKYDKLSLSGSCPQVFKNGIHQLRRCTL